MKLTSVTIEGMHKVDHQHIELSDVSYLFGPNGAGKSTVMEAIQLALLGYIPGTSKTKESIFKHANGKVMSVSVDIDAGQDIITIKRTWTQSNSGIQAYVSVTPDTYNIDTLVSDIELPIFNFSEFVGMTANKLKDWFIQFLPSVDVSVDWDKVLQDGLKDADIHMIDEDFILSTVSDIHQISATGSEKIRQVNEMLKSTLSFTNKELARINSTIQSLIFYDDVDASISETQIKAQIAELEGRRNQISTWRADEAQNANIKSELAEYSDCSANSYKEDARYIDAAVAIPKLQDDLAEVQKRIDKRNADTPLQQEKKYQLIAQVAEQETSINSWKTIIQDGGKCPYTHSTCTTAQTIIDDCKQKIEDASQRIVALNEEIAEITDRIELNQYDISLLNNMQRTLSDEIETKQAVQVALRDRYAEKQALESRLVSVPEDIGNADEISAQIEELRSLQVKCAANQNYNNIIDQLTQEKVATSSHIDMLKAWIKLTGVNGLQNDNTVTTPFNNLQDMLDPYIRLVFGSGVTSQFNLEAKANSFSFGISRSGNYIPFNLLSSGEKCLYTLALMTSLVNLSKSPLKLIMVDDLLDHLDDANILKLFDAFSKVPDIQMIFAGVKLVRNDCVIEM